MAKVTIRNKTNSIVSVPAPFNKLLGRDESYTVLGVEPDSLSRAAGLNTLIKTGRIEVIVRPDEVVDESIGSSELPVVEYATEAELLIDTVSPGTIAYAQDTGVYWFRRGTAWQASPNTAGGGISPFGAGVTGVTICTRPRTNKDAGGGRIPDEPFNADAYIVHGSHVTNFSRPSGGTYLITLDRDYEPDEIAVIVLGMGALDGLVQYPFGTWASEWPDQQLPPTDFGLVSIPTAWQTGPNGEKNQRVVTALALGMGDGSVVTCINKHSDPITIMLVFFDRTLADFRNPPLPG